MKYIKQIPKYIAYIAVALPLFGLSANAQEQLLLSERFTNNTGDGADLVDYGFNGLMFDPKHGDPTKPVDVSVDEGQVHATSTAVSPDVGVELTFDEADTGHVYMWTGGKETWYLLNTEAAAIDRSQMELSRVTWYHKRTDGQLADFDVRVVVEIDGIYYASDNYGETGEDVLEWKSKEYTFTTDGSAWRVLTANIAEDWNLAAETLDGPLPGGNIDSIGLYVRRGLGGGSVALDELEIYAVPAMDEHLLFSERFTNNTGDGADLVDYGFNGLMYDPKHGDPTKPVDVSVDEGQVHATSTAVSPDVGVELTFDESDTGHVYMWTGGKETWYLLNTEAAAIDRSQMELSRVTWYHQRTSGELGDFDVRVVVEIDGVYYASDNYGETGEDVLEWKSKEYTFTTDGSAWRVLTANIAEDWNLAAETLDGPLPDGNIDSIGLYVRRGLGGGSVALDELEIYVSTSGNMETWAGYPVNANGDVNTGTWLGWLNVAHKPWILSYSMNQWLFIDESAVSDSGSWVYVINF